MFYTNVIFQRYYLDTFSYTIAPNNVYFYEDQYFYNINVFLYFDYKTRASHP